MEQFAVDLARDAGAGGDVDAADRILLQFTAGDDRRRWRWLSRRELRVTVRIGLEEACARIGAQEGEDEDGNENFEDEITKHGVGRETASSRPATLHLHKAYFFFLGAGALGFL